MKQIMHQLLMRQSLSYEQCQTLFSLFDEMNTSQLAAALSLLAAKRESIDEIMGAREYVLAHSCVSPQLLEQCPFDMVDMVGTGGDGSGTFNISTAASLVVASCGVAVAKHGGGSITSHAGSADVMAALNLVRCHTAIEAIEHLRHYGYAYLQASRFNPVFQRMRALRQSLAFPTLLNIVGPLTNPLHPKRCVLGVYRRDLVSTLALILQKIGVIHALVVHAETGMDELSVTSKTYVAHIQGGDIREYMIDPEMFSFKPYSSCDLSGGTPQENAQIIHAILNNQLMGAKRDVVLLNAAAGLLVADKVSDLQEGIAMADEAITQQRASRLLSRLQVEVCDV